MLLSRPVFPARPNSTIKYLGISRTPARRRVPRRIVHCPDTTQAGINYRCDDVEYRFEEPVKFEAAEAQEPVVFAVLVTDENCSPRPFRTLYFGHGTTPGKHHENYREWLHKARSRALYISVYPAAGSTEDERCDLVSRLTEAYRPMCSRYW